MPLITYAANWIELESKWYIDIESTIKDSFYTHRYSFWMKYLNDDGQFFNEPEAFLKDKIWYAKVKVGIDCQERKFRLEDYIYYNMS